MHPDATMVELSTDNGSTGDNYTNTVFDDEASTAITAGTAPFTGSYRPEGSLSDVRQQVRHRAPGGCASSTTPAPAILARCKRGA